MSEKRIVYKVPSEVKKQSIETLKVRKTTLEYLRQNGFKTVEDIIDKQLEMGEIEKYAREELGMMKAESYQKFYIDMNMPDEGTAVKSENRAQNAVSGVPGTLMNAFRVLK